MTIENYFYDSENRFFFLQHSLVSEIRDIVYPEDRLRFDELMFRHGVTVNVLSNNVATLYGRSGVGFNSFPTLLIDKFISILFFLCNYFIHSKRREFLKIGLEVEAAAMLN